MLNPSVIGGDPKLSSDIPSFAYDLSKRLKVEPGLQPLCVMSPGGASPKIDTPGASGQLDEEYKPNAAMEEMIITFLNRFSNRCIQGFWPNKSSTSPSWLPRQGLECE